MKIKKLLKVFGAIIFAFVILSSCGSDNPSFDKDISTLKYSKKLDKYFIDDEHTILFTGKAGEKNSSNQTLQYWEVNNGYISALKNWDVVNGNRILSADVQYLDGKKHTGWWNKHYDGAATSENNNQLLLSSRQWDGGDIVFHKEWSEFGDKLILTTDLTYKNDKISNGFQTEIAKYYPSEGQGEGELVITTNYKEYSTGKVVKEWSIISYDSGYPYYDDYNYLTFNNGNGNTIRLCSKIPGTKQKKLDRFFYHINQSYYDGFFESYFECLESQDLPGFYIYLED